MTSSFDLREHVGHKRNPPIDLKPGSASWSVPLSDFELKNSMQQGEKPKTFPNNRWSGTWALLMV
ncbi:hypothetical protein XTG29_03236 [Xanthomonas translucens pv. graminis ART-Xtg29]|nr:hypothetical protein XTG29_03236 [Xanthomonas translucens pv. graminis ART-Xtg29]SBV48012.1 hypothetical protein XTGART29_2666 [Xanthomonas translucens pv. graminis ART-Xtg29]